MRERKVETISFRTTDRVREELERIADERGISVGSLVDIEIRKAFGLTTKPKASTRKRVVAQEV